jgi:arginine deiminase
VQNNWDRWVWKQKTYNNEYTPTLEGWKKDILEVGEKLANEDIKVHLFCDRDIYQEVIDEFGKTNKIIIREIDIPVGMAKIPYVRDQSVTWYKYPILGNMALDIRIGEEHVISEIYGLIGLRPIHRLRWGMYKDYLLKSKMEGGNFFIVKTDRGTSLLTGIGVRGSNRAAFQILSKILPEDIKLYGLPLSGYIKYWSETGAVHLDVVLLYLGELNGTYYAILDPMRVGFYSLLEYDREKDAFNTISLGEYAKQYGIILEETPRESGSPITLANALNLGNGKLLVDSYNRKMNSFLVKEIGVDIIEVDIPHIEAGGGGPRCITRELWL